MVDSSKPPLLGTSSTSVNKLEQYDVPLKRKSTAQDQDTHRSQPEYVSDKEGPKILIFSTLSFLCFSLAHLSECDNSCYPACCNDTIKDLSNHQEVKNIMYKENQRTDYQEGTPADIFCLPLDQLLQHQQSRDYPQEPHRLQSPGEKHRRAHGH